MASAGDAAKRHSVFVAGPIYDEDGDEVLLPGWPEVDNEHGKLVTAALEAYERDGDRDGLVELGLVPENENWEDED